MPPCPRYNFYHGKTGVVFNVTKTAVGVEVTKVVGNRQLRKRLHVRIEHIKPSRCQEEFKNRVADNEKTKAEAKKTGKFIKTLKRLPKDPKAGYIVKAKKQPVNVMCAVPYELLA